jgi:fatty acid/phospholipid biosynthesis enzyme
LWRFYERTTSKNFYEQVRCCPRRSALQKLRETVNPNEYPGAPLLGVQGVVIALHGASLPLGIANGIRGAV